ncbi:MAG TPA: mannose-6-phosphate isomerase, class I, partial [Jiangellaceae bacterium]|nr:mannose-6-phosphate isomerase, class I [Jiangellaceae bacterium]
MPLILDNPVRTYAWGSPTVIPDLLGVPPTGEPQAELWMGAHPSAPSIAEIGGERVSLAELIEKDPPGMLGAEVVERFGPRLPYLLKILAVERPLSIQAHPNGEQAAQGFAAEEAAGVPLDAVHRSYRDRSHKPEMVVALTEFEALLGFRDPTRSADLIDTLDVPDLRTASSRLRDEGAAAL